MYYIVGNSHYWYEVHGEGTPLVLLHGFTGSSATWKNLIDSQNPDIQYITIDLPGHGRTKVDELKSMEDFCYDLYNFIRYLKLDSFFLAGYSMGGRTALTYAVMFPNTIRGLILESASPGLEKDLDRKNRIEADELLIHQIETEGLEAFVDYWENISLFYSQKSLPKEIQLEVRKSRLGQSEKGLIQSLRGMGTGRQASNWVHLEKLDFPVLLLVGELDKKFININQKMREKIPLAQLEIVKDAGHAIHVEKPNIYDKLVTAFVNISHY